MLTLSHPPHIFTTLDGTSIVGRNILSAANDGERHGSGEQFGVLGSLLIVGIDGRRVDANILRPNDFADLCE